MCTLCDLSDSSAEIVTGEIGKLGRWQQIHRSSSIPFSFPVNAENDFMPSFSPGKLRPLAGFF
jgi:hypothetical protein